MSEPNLQEILDQLTNLNKRVIQLEESLLLVSDIYRYDKLKTSLAKGDWFEADLETLKVIIDVAGKDQDNLSPEDIQTLPIDALKVIDRLWLNYSQNRFGFSVQLRCYQELGGSRQTTITNDIPLLEKWGDKLGWRQKNQWRKCEELDYSLNAPVGCHPSQWWNSPYGAKMTNYFLARLMDAKLL